MIIGVLSYTLLCFLPSSSVVELLLPPYPNLSTESTQTDGILL